MKALIFPAVALFFWTCANVTSPTGGPKDETPPKLLSSIPKQGQTNYSGRGITLEFDEYLKLKNPKEEIMITPLIDNPKFTVKKNLMLIEFEDKLQENTTYSIAFREAIQDLNEGNPAEDLHLAFSTGNVIDSLKISGTVTQLLKGVPSEKYTVGVYTQDTFNILKHKPGYFSRTDKAGKFTITNLKGGNYYIYAWDDKNKNLSLESQSEKFGFLPNVLTLAQDINSLQIYTIPLDSRPIKVTGIRSLGHFTKLRLNKNVVSYKLTSKDAADRRISTCFAGSFSEIDIFPNKHAGDSTLINFSALDSLGQTLDSTFYLKKTNAKSLKEKIKLEPGKAEVQEETQKFTAKLKLTELINKIVPDSIYIWLDSLRTVPMRSSEIVYDTLLKSVSLERSFQKKDSIDWPKAKLIFGGMAFTSIHGDSTKRASAPIALIKTEERAVLIIESKTAVPNTFVQVVNDKFEVIASQPHNKLITFKNLPASTVMIRAVTDQNQNGKWDNGDPIKKILPETMIFYQNPDKKKQVPLRANWEVNIKWDL